MAIDRRHFVMSAAAALAAAAMPTAGHAGVAEHVVEIRRFKFAPAMLGVRPGDTITWINRDIVPHTATARNGLWDTGPVETDGTATVTVAEGFEGPYFCRFHPNMKGSVTIGR